MSKEIPPATVIFKSGILTEEKNVIWIINNFTAHQESKSPKNGDLFLEIEAGKSIQRPSKWRLQLNFTSTNEIGFYLKLKECTDDGPNHKLYAAYRLSIILDPKNPDDRVLRCTKTPFKEYLHEIPSWGFPKMKTVDQLRNELEALVDDTLILYVEIEILGKEIVNPSDFPVCTPEILKQKGLEGIGKHYGDLLRTGEDSDFVIRVKQVDSENYVERKVHRTVLSARSPVFKAMLETQMLEKETGSVTIEDLSPKGLDILLEFIYTGNLHDDWKLVPEEVINAAEKYDFPEIKKYCDDWLHTVCTTENAVIFLKVAKTHGLLEAVKNIEIFIKENFETVLNSVVSNTSIHYSADNRSKKCFIL